MRGKASLNEEQTHFVVILREHTTPLSISQHPSRCCCHNSLCHHGSTAGTMAPFPYLPLLAIMASVVSLTVAQVNVFVYAGFMMEHLGAVNDKDKSGKNWRRPTDQDL